MFYVGIFFSFAFIIDIFYRIQRFLCLMRTPALVLQGLCQCRFSVSHSVLFFPKHFHQDYPTLLMSLCNKQKHYSHLTVEKGLPQRSQVSDLVKVIYLISRLQTSQVSVSGRNMQSSFGIILGGDQFSILQVLHQEIFPPRLP